MKKIIISFLILLFAVWLGATMHRSSGYVLISYNDWTLETSLWFAIIVLTILFLLFYILLRFGGGVKAITTRIKQWVVDRRKHRARKQTILGLYDFAEGNWASSEKKLLRAAKYSDMPLINYLAAAFMAQRQQAPERRDNYLLLAQKIVKDQPITVGLTQARLQMGNQQWEEALATLQQLHHLRPKNAFILQLLEQVYLELKDWNGLRNLLPVLRKRHAFGIEEINQLELRVYKEWLLAGKDNTIETRWSVLSRYLQKQPTLVAIYVEYLLANNRATEAEITLKMILRKVLDEHLIGLYAALPSDNPIKKLARAENWLKTNSENSSLLLCLGHICRQQKLWGKAHYYLEKSARLAPTPAIYFELGQILEEQNDLRGALGYYRQGLQATITKKP